ncbi:MAG: molybdenum cofactor guanylyltransferase [Anaerolineae bacterium]|nr:molybdenum cofactor guanylyltransferase [Anaerolineae bacterium]
MVGETLPDAIKATGIVLAGGASRRMGQSKAWIELGGSFFIVRVIEALRRVCDQVLIVANDAAEFQSLGANVTPDEFPGTGSLGGLYSGLNAAKNELAIAVACDMPFLDHCVLKFLISLSPDYDIVIPSVRDGRHADKPGAAADTAKRKSLHPLHAVYRKSCLPPMRQAIAQNDLRMISFHDRVRVRIVEQIELESYDREFLSLWNVNTPQELERANARIMDQGV